MKNRKRIVTVVCVSVMVLCLSFQAFANNDVLKKFYESLLTSKTTYYIDSVSGDDQNNGKSESKPFKSLEKVNSMVFSAGDKILFKAGSSYIGQLMPKGSGNAVDGPIVIGKYGEGANPIINSNGSLENDGAVIRLYNQEYIEISDLELTGYSEVQGLRNGVLVIARDYGTLNHIYIKNLNIHDIPTNHTKSNLLASINNGGDADNTVNEGATAGAICFRALRGGDRVRTRFNDILVDGNTISKTGFMGYGVAIASDWASVMSDGHNGEVWAPYYGSTNVLISNNDFKNTSTAIRVQAMDGSVGNGVVIQNNVSYKPDNCDSNSGMWLTCSNDVIWQYNEIYALDNGGSNDCGAFDADGDTTRTIFQYNYTHDNRGEAVMFCNINWDANWRPTNAVGNIYRYNISQNDMWGANSSHGRFWVQKGAKDSYFYNNTVYIGGGLDGHIFSVQESENNNFFNNLIINMSDRATYSISKKSTCIIENNLFYGYHPSTEPTGNNNIQLNLTDSSPVVDAGTGGIGRDTLDGYKLVADSPCIGSGKIIENNGGKDFYGNAVNANNSPDIGAHQYGDIQDTTAPTAVTNLSAVAENYETVNLKWTAATDDIGIDRYVIYANGKPIGRTTNCNFTASELEANTDYKFVVMAFDAADNYSETSVKTSTLSLSGNQKKLHISSIKIYNSDYSEQTTFKPQELVLTRYKVVDADGTAVKNARVEVLKEALGHNDYQLLASYTNEQGIAEIGYNTSYYSDSKVNVKLTVKKIVKENCTYDSENPENQFSSAIELSGVNEEKFANLVKNPEFNLVDEFDNPKNWSIATAGDVMYEITKGISIDESEALEIRSTGNFSTLVMQNISLVPNGMYTLTMYVKNTAAGASVNIVNSGDNKSLGIPETEKWQQIVIPNVSVTTSMASIQINITGEAGNYTMIDKIEFSRNLVKNSDFKQVHPNVHLPSNFYYKTENSDFKADGSGTYSDLKNQVSVVPIYGSSFTNAIKFGGNGEFNVIMGQDISNLANGIYTFTVSTVNVGNAVGKITVKNYGGETITKEIGLSSNLASVIINDINVTSGKATIEISVSGGNGKEDYIILMRPNFSQRSDYPGNDSEFIFAGENLLASYNPSFENDGTTTAGMPSGWTSVWTTGTANPIATDEEAHAGKYSLKISIDKNSTVNVKTSAVKFADLPNGNYTFGFWAKGDLKVKPSVTPGGAYEFSMHTEQTTDWKYYSIENIPVTDGTITVGFWNETKSDTVQTTYIDDVELFLQENYLANSDFEEGISSGWSNYSNDGFAYVKEVSGAQSGNKAIRLVLTGTPSELTLSNETALTNIQDSLYEFSAYIKGNSVVELKIKADNKPEIIKTYTANDTWQKISASVEVEDRVRKIEITAKNPDGLTSSYVTVDNTAFINNATAKNVASLIGDLANVPVGVNKITLPNLRDGFLIKIIKTSHPDVVDLDGNVITPKEHTTVTLTYRVINLNNPSDFCDTSSTVRVIGSNPTNNREEKNDENENSEPKNTEVDIKKPNTETPEKVNVIDNVNDNDKKEQEQEPSMDKSTGDNNVNNKNNSNGGMAVQSINNNSNLIIEIAAVVAMVLILVLTSLIIWVILKKRKTGGRQNENL